MAVGTFAEAPAYAQGGDAATPSPEAVQKAQAAYKKGAGLFRQKKYNLALEEFRASYATVASPNSRLYIARCYAELGDHVEAYLEFTGVAAEAEARAATEPRYGKTKETALFERDELAKKMALVTVTVEHPESASSLTIGGKEVPRDQWGQPFPAKVGPVEVVVSSTVGSPVTQNLDLIAGDNKDVTLDAQANAPPPPPPPGEVEVSSDSLFGEGLRPFAYIAGGVGVVGLGVFAVAGIMTNGTYSDLSDSCGGPCPSSRADDVDTGKTQQTIANVGLVVGAVGIAAGATLFVLSMSDDSSTEQKDEVSAKVVVGPGYAGLRGAF